MATGPISAKKRLLLAKIEAIYGTDPVPTGANALQVTDMDASPMEAETVDRDLLRPFFGQSERLMSQINAKISFGIELAGHAGGVVGKMPKIDQLLQACGFKGEQKTIEISSIIQAAGIATAEIEGHGLKVNNKILISGATQAAYNGLQTITEVVDEDTVKFAVAGNPASPATGAPVMNSAYEYTPISDDIPSLTFYYNQDGVQHKITGAKGTFSVDIKVKEIPKFKFDFVGINNAAVDTPAILADLADFTIPEVVNTQNTGDFSLLGFSGALESFTFGLNNAVNYVTLVGKEYVGVFDRKMSGSTVFEAPRIADKNFWDITKEQITGLLTIRHGSRKGNRIKLTFPRVMLDSPKYSESNNVMMMTAGVSIMPNLGNDEATISFE